MQQHNHVIGMKSVRDINLVSSIMTWLLFKFPMINVSQGDLTVTLEAYSCFYCPPFLQLILFILDLKNDKKEEKMFDIFCS